MKKYELCLDKKISAFGITLFRIKALISFGNVKAGEIGGYIEKEENLSQSGNAWVSDDAQVSGDAQVFGDARVCGDARVYDNAWVYGNARVYDNARVSGDARVYDDAWACGDARVYGNAWVYGDARVYDNAWVFGNTHYIQMGPIGSRDDTITFMRTKDAEIAVKIGCFFGTIDEFEEKVKETHGNNHHAKEYLLAAEIAKSRIDLTPEEEKQ